MTQAISDALVPFETAVQRDAAIAAALAAYYILILTGRGRTGPRGNIFTHMLEAIPEGPFFETEV